MSDEDVAVSKLIEEHKKRKEEPLHLAVRFSTSKHGKHIHLFEVLGTFGGGAVARDRKLFTIAFSSTPQLPLKPGTELRLVLTNPEELEVALNEEWPSLAPILTSKRDKTATVLSSDAKGKRLWQRMR